MKVKCNFVATKQVQVLLHPRQEYMVYKCQPGMKRTRDCKLQLEKKTSTGDSEEDRDR